MSHVRVFEPALCCNTGVCGPELDQDLVVFTADLNHVREAGGDVTRFNLASDPGSFVSDPVVVDFLQVAGSEGLPLVLVDGVTVLTGRYPTRQELLRFAGMVERQPLAVVGQAPGSPSPGCCSASSGQSCC